ncbi:hypothetical protein OsJ_30717 [Oryza sativa Japonica Group]|uniref:Uncharacterized protein n=1 Tax=Oryza sativa subsp. japonica TaxID=39947 RepID=A3C2I7_ORYSJ|nr:hypothetical protein OsJ_30717 [Oryza sativa Japonica Group]
MGWLPRSATAVLVLFLVLWRDWGAEAATFTFVNRCTDTQRIAAPTNSIEMAQDNEILDKN